MKMIILAALIAGVSFPAKAQISSSEALGGAVLGGIAGGIIGHNSGRHAGEGIAIGAGAGLLLGAITSSHRPRTPMQPPVYSPAPATVIVTTPVVNQPVAPVIPSPPAPGSPMSSANALFGR